MPERLDEPEAEAAVTEPEPIGETEAAKRLGVSKGTLANWRWRRYGPAYLKVGRRIEYQPSDIQAWRIAERRDPSEAAAS